MNTEQDPNNSKYDLDPPEKLFSRAFYVAAIAVASAVAIWRVEPIQDFAIALLEGLAASGENG